MATGEVSLLPLHELLTALEAWRAEPGTAQRQAVSAGLARIVAEYGADGLFLRVVGPPLPSIDAGTGSLSDASVERLAALVEHDVGLAGTNEGGASLWIDGSPRSVESIAGAIELAIGAVWSKHDARLQRKQLEALDVAVRSIAGIQSVEHVLQQIVDHVRRLVEAEYAALGIVGPFGQIDQFITSGVTEEQRARIGHVPRGRGLLGLIIREDRSFLIEDIATDPRRHGFPEHHPEMHSFLGAPVRAKGRSIGNLYLTNKTSARAFSGADLRLVERFALHAGIAIDNARLHEEIGRLAIVAERERISQDLHDSIIQSLYAISLSLEDLPDIIGEDAGEGAARADRAIDSIHGTIRDIRNFIMGLQPELLVDGDIGAGIESLVAEFRANTLIDLELSLDRDLPELPHDHAAQLLAITREGLSNIARHSAATRASLEVTTRDDTLRLVIGDNGRGFDVSQPRSTRQHGLTNLKARAEAAGGSLTLTSEAGAGTRLEVEIPTGAEGGESPR